MENNEFVKETHFMLSTIDNPFNPFEDFSSWFMFDNSHNYNSCGYLARIVQLDSKMTQKEEDEAIEAAINEILLHDFTNIRIKVSKEELVRA